MSHRLGVRLLAATLLLPVSVVLVASGTAHAERTVTKDAVGDALGLTLSDLLENEDAEFVPSPEHKATDITRTVVDHRAERLRVTVGYRDLRRDFQHSQLVLVRTPEKKFAIMADRLGGPAFPFLIGGGRGDLIGCAGLEASVDGPKNRIAVSIPTSCLGSPRWVRVGVLAQGVDRGAMAANGDNYEMFADDANSSDFSPEDDNVRMGPKVHRD